MAIKYTKGKKPTKKPARKAKATNKDGCQNAGKYKTKETCLSCKKGGAYPVNTCSRAKSAVKLSEHAGRNAGKVKACAKKAVKRKCK